MSERPLVLLACSARKRTQPEELPARERYDGPSFRVLRRFEREHLEVGLEVWVLSARFGAIRAEQSVPFYDQQLDLQGMELLRPLVAATLQARLREQLFAPVFVDVGGRYKGLLSDVEELGLPSVEWAQGAPGVRAAGLRLWLQRLSGQADYERFVLPFCVSNTPEAALFQGREIGVDSYRLSEVAVQWRNSASLRLPASLWRVAIKDATGIQFVPLKWLVALLVSSPPDSFSTAQGIAFLKKIGMSEAIFCETPKKIL